MVVPISDWRHARSKIGQATVGATESAELDFNLAADQAIEIAQVAGNMIMATATSGSVIAPTAAVQTLHVEDGTIEPLSDTDVTAVDSFDNDSEVIFTQNVNEMTFNGTTEAAAYLTITPNGPVTYARPILSPINLTHSIKLVSGITLVGILTIEYRYVRLSDRELGFQFARRRR